MTAIVTDGREIGADGRVQADGRLKTDSYEKLVRLGDGSIAGLCGDVRDIELARHWLLAGAPQDKRPDLSDEFEAIRLYPGGRLEWFDQKCVWCPYSTPCGIGSGGAIAEAAVRLGHCVEDAIRAAAEMDCHVGGKITVLKPKRVRK